MSIERRDRRYAMRHEYQPSGDTIDVGVKMGKAACWFCALLPIGIAVAVLIVGWMD